MSPESAAGMRRPADARWGSSAASGRPSRVARARGGCARTPPPWPEPCTTGMARARHDPAECGPGRCRSGPGHPCRRRRQGCARRSVAFAWQAHPRTPASGSLPPAWPAGLRRSGVGPAERPRLPNGIGKALTAMQRKESARQRLWAEAPPDAPSRSRANLLLRRRARRHYTSARNWRRGHCNTMAGPWKPRRT